MPSRAVWRRSARATRAPEFCKPLVTPVEPAGMMLTMQVVKHGGKEERLGVAMELRPQWRQMMESKYAKFLMRKLIRYCPSIRPLMIEDLTPVLPHLLTHADAVQPLSDFYDLYASAKERRALVRGLYPKEVRLTSSSATADDDVQGLDSVLEGMPNEQGRLRVLEGVEKTVLNVYVAQTSRETGADQPGSMQRRRPRSTRPSTTAWSGNTSTASTASSTPRSQMPRCTSS